MLGMIPLIIPLDWVSVQSFLYTCYSFLANTIFDCGLFYFSLWDCVVYGVITGGVGDIIYVSITGGFMHD